ncbi:MULTISPECIES: 3-isopropylmalate dehydratase large subunit [Prauserella salsuginis group]|uniref:3-isopropylmalate dehydratase large subunit n=1 Tax=Prauserella salsuginis TaxID=387889 RepID=A0ABW6G0M5_9PSEU|nr:MULTISPECIES: 3-isopropylmalate dehydratase large subunit [Prauserella salsuginis group]MCR3721907.1 3-isopropylmalate/(R)-2-methylmalate dehydratase large subunit [Prauserella flava]MCR3735912.1 3-isopropylmalate/(R)-2-methylmalate dehydratase large subunit [Prauserella salsuginis]
MAKTAADKIWDAHVVRTDDAGRDLLYIDMHLLHEANTPVAFDSLRAKQRAVRRPELTLGTEDHVTPTIDTGSDLRGTVAENFVNSMRRNCDEFGIELFELGHESRGIVHVIGPEMGLSQPGTTIVCCDSHTTTHGAMGALAFGIGTSQVEHVLATQTLPMTRMKNMRITIEGVLPADVSAKDVALAVIAKIGTAGGQGHVIEYQGSTVRAMSMEARMTLCNMSIEAGARAGLVAPDEVTFAYLAGREYVPAGEAFEAEREYWEQFVSDEDVVFDREVYLDAKEVSPRVSWGTNPGQTVTLGDTVPAPDSFQDPVERSAAERALTYMDLKPGTPMRSIPIDAVFIGSCTNGRIEDLRQVAEIWRGRQVAPTLRVHLSPGSEAVRRQAVAEGLAEIFSAAGVPLRSSGCSMCVAINGEVLAPGVRTASTNNRNFEGRQGPGVRTHVVSPAVAAATAVAGHLAAPSDLQG